VQIFDTERLSVRALAESDAGFMLALLNDPSWLRMIGDRGVRTEQQARAYIRDGAMACYAQLGYGFYLVQHRQDGAPIGICGLALREYLDAPDIGFAFLPQYRGQGYAYEAAAATLSHAREVLRMKRVLATTRPYNDSSAKLLLKLGLKFERRIPHPNGEGELMLFSTEC